MVDDPGQHLLVAEPHGLGLPHLVHDHGEQPREPPGGRHDPRPDRRGVPQFAGWCRQHDIRPFGARRADIECFARDLEARGRARATVTRRLYTIAGFYRYAVEEEMLDHSPALHVRRPRLDYESHATGLDRNEVGALLVAAGLDLLRSMR